MIEDIPLVRQSYISIAEYRGLNVSWRETLEDTIATCHLLASRNDKNEQFLHLKRGI